MNARPILFSAPMIRALLAGTKTQTRRVVKPQPDVSHWQGIQSMFGFAGGDRSKPFGDWHHWRVVGPDYPDGDEDDVWCPWAAGELAWVRETWREHEAPDQDGETIAYRADRPEYLKRDDDPSSKPWGPSIFMPRQHSRMTLRITEVRVQRLQEINEADAIAEGAEPLLVAPDGGSSPHVEGYRRLWDSINGAGAWDADPFVWALTFEVLQKNVDEVLQAAAKHKEQA